MVRGLRRPRQSATPRKDLLNAPFVWIGTVEEIQEKFDAHRTGLGIERYVVRASVIRQVRNIIDVTTP